MNAPPPASGLPVVFAGVQIVAGKVTILDDVNLTLAAGPPTILIGPNGAGKTTLLRAAMGLVSPTRGSVIWGFDGDKPPRLRAMLFQRSVMLRRSAGGNLRYALAAAGVALGQRKTRAAELLSLVGMDGLEGRPARRLSGGEQRRLALARALARDPALLFLDEPTASLDPAATKAIEDIILHASSRGVKVVMSTHDIGQARRLAGDIILLHRGHIVEHTNASTFFAAPRSEEAVKFLAGELLV